MTVHDLSKLRCETMGGCGIYGEFVRIRLGMACMAYSGRYLCVSGVESVRNLPDVSPDRWGFGKEMLPDYAFT
ncbi:MAG: hypothetical protein AAF922_12280 [Pseudomonadota bacterium]